MNDETPMESSLFSTDPAYGKTDKGLVAIVGHGTMGKAVERSLAPHIDRFLVDPIYNVTIDQLIEREPTLTFVCTSARVDSADTIDAVLKLIRKTQSAVVLKTTVDIGILDKLVRTLHGDNALDRFVYAPDLSSDHNTDDDYINPKYIILGGVSTSCNQLLEFFHWNTLITLPKNHKEDAGIHICAPNEASIIFHGIQAYLTTKTMFFSELSKIVESMGDMGVNFPTTARAVIADPRIGKTNWFSVGDIDTSAIKAIVAMHEGSLPLLETIIKSNEEG